jgi:alkylhydroperoxidase/carboxymuconolactone decarboxylase family protein YurZ
MFEVLADRALKVGHTGERSAVNAPLTYCLDVDTGNAKKAGATREEIAEVTFITAALHAGPP